MATAVSTIPRTGLPAAVTPDAGEVDVRGVVKGFALIGGGLCALWIILPIEFALAVSVPLLAFWFWRAPVRGIFLLIAAAAMIEIFGLGFPDSLTDRIAFFINLNNSSAFTVPITPAEIVIITVGLLAYARAASEGKLHWPGGRLVTAYSIYFVVVLGAEIHGLLSKGDFKTSLWEMKPQAYGFILFFLATTLVEKRSQIVQLALVFLLAVSVKALIGDYRYFITLHGVLGSHENVLGHEDSYFLAMLVTAGIAALVWLKNRRLLVVMSLMSALGLVALLANYRRAGVYALGAALAVIFILAFHFQPSLRKRLGWLAVVFLIASGIFVASAWNKQYGVQAQIVRPIRSMIDPSARDFNSDAYRIAETANLRVTFRTSPIFGVGFGSPFIIAYPMADISAIYPLWNVIPHNSLMWVNMRMGAVGYAAFWGLIGLAILEAFNILRTRRDPLQSAFAAFAIAAVVGEIVVGYADIQLESYRNLIFLGVVLGVLNRLPQLPETADV